MATAKMTPRKVEIQEVVIEEGRVSLDLDILEAQALRRLLYSHIGGNGGSDEQSALLRVGRALQRAGVDPCQKMMRQGVWTNTLVFD